MAAQWSSINSTDSSRRSDFIKTLQIVFPFTPLTSCTWKLYPNTVIVEEFVKICFACLIWFFTSQSTVFQLCWDGSSRVEPVLSKNKCVMLKDTTQQPWWGSNHQPLGLESSTLPLSHCAPKYALWLLAIIAKVADHVVCLIRFTDFTSK